MRIFSEQALHHLMTFNGFVLNLKERCESETFQRFTADDVIKACLQLKSNKKDADLHLFSDAIINALHDFYAVLCTLINAIIFHGYVPAQWLLGIIIPLLKSANIDKSVTSSYRPITLSSLFGKIVDIIILDRYHLASPRVTCNLDLNEHTLQLTALMLLKKSLNIT